MIYNIHKPPGPTSHDIVNQIRRRLGIKKVGHAGTLDPFAEGVLIILTKSDTKKSNEIMHQEKEYVTEIKLGAISDTYDRTGEIQNPLPAVATALPARNASRIDADGQAGKIPIRQLADQNSKIPTSKLCPQIPDIEEINQILQKFTGEIEQIPPMYSAIKINGKKLYDLARKGIEIERKPRKIKISEIEIISYIYPLLKIRVVCSSGTYIRSLANDIGKELGVGGYLESLVRTRVGEYLLNNSLKIEQI